MPKIVDPERRRELIADALFAVLRDGGISAVTLAGVAERAGLAIGSVRHFLGTREEMMVFAFDTIADRFRERILARSDELLADIEAGRLPADGRLERTVELLCEFLPLDATRRDEAVVWVEFETAARTDARLAATSRRAAEESGRLVRVIIDAMRGMGVLEPEADPAVESARLGALLDGMTARSVLHPEMLDANEMRRIVREHLRGLRARSREAVARVDGSS